MNTQLNETHTLTIGSIPIMASYGITDLIVNFKKANPLFNVNIIEGESADLKKNLLTGKCELAFVREEHATAQDFLAIPFADDHLVAVLPSYHRLAEQKVLELVDLTKEDFLFLQPGTVLYNLCVSECKKAGFTPNITYTGQRAENIIDLIEKGMGISLLMSKPISYLTNPKIRLIPIKPKISTTIKVYHPRNIPLTDTAKHFIEFLKR
jgi:DNA-binding transcriptional LysR family regulator